MKKFLFSCILLGCISNTFSQDTVIVQTLTYDSTGRDYVFQFPTDDPASYEKILMQYSMRCKDGLVSTGSDRNKGCGEWDYSCNTYITDSSQTDSVKATHPDYIITNFSGTTYNYSTTPTNTYYRFTQKNATYSSTASEFAYQIGAGTDSINHPFGTNNQTSKVQYLWTASELSSAGLTGSTDITSLRLKIVELGDDVDFLRIKMKHTPKSTLDPASPDVSGFTEVFFKDVDLVLDTNEFLFYNNFNWNGTSNIIVELSWTNNTSGTTNKVHGTDVGSNIALISNNDGYFECDGGSYINLGRYDNTVGNNPRTIEMWAKVNVFNNAGIFQAGGTGVTAGDFSLRTTTTDNQWRGQLWGSPDFDVTLSGSKDNWHHYAMVYDGTTTYIYYDGVQSGSSTADLYTTFTDFMIGTWNGSKLNGLVDGLRIWNVALSQTTIDDWKNRIVDNTHPNYGNLQGDFGLDMNLSDASVNNNTSGEVIGKENWYMHRGNNIFKDFETSTFRPNITFVQGSYTTNVQNITVTDTLENAPDKIVTYSVSGTDIVEGSTSQGWSEPYEYVYNASGTKIDSSATTLDKSITINSLDYYAKYPMAIEIMSFVTPYGIGLDFGLEGKMWQFDVTDYAPVLNGKRRLYLTGGIYQEEMDIRFLFIKGTPPHETKKVQQVWRVAQRSYSSIINDDYFAPRDVSLVSGATDFKVKSVITGHGQEGEFIGRYHFLNLDGDLNEATWRVWTECSENPIYPQGGTWIYDRAGWCPGAPSDVMEYNFKTSSGVVNVDYGVSTATGDSRYIVNTQLVSYGPANFTNDAAVDEVIRPSKRTEFSRQNPMCLPPIIRIKNTGSDSLNSVKIVYSVSGGPEEEYLWEGSLGFMETEDVTLPLSSGAFWVGDGSDVFIATVTEPNGTTDEYTNNNTMYSPFEMPDIYTENFIIELGANNYYSQNSITVTDSRNEDVVYLEYLSSGTHKDTMKLGDGCYQMTLKDNGDDGLEFWNNPNQSPGYLLLKGMNGAMLKSFEPDFGGFISYSFIIGDVNNIYETMDTYFNVYPNPSHNGKFIVDIESNDTKILDLKVYDAQGKLVLVLNQNTAISKSMVIDLKGQPAGVYYVTVNTPNWKKSRKIMVSH